MARLRAARALAETATIVDLPRLNSARSGEDDSWTQRALDRAIERIIDGRRQREPAADDSSDDMSGVQAQALQIATKRVLHEIRPVMQSLYRAARADLPQDFDDSAVKHGLDRMSDLLDALQILGEAAEAPRLVEFDLTELVGSQLKDEGIAEALVLLARSEPVVVNGDPALVALAFINLLRNALDASVEADAPVVVNWGRGDEKAWVSVLDSGQGLPADALKAAFDVGSTTRSEQGHFGLGLPTAAQAMSSLGGAISLRPRRDNGTAAEARWPQ
jgi:signal transduction histidine kinase